MIYFNDPTIVVIDWGPVGTGSTNPFVAAKFRLLEDHWINDQLYLAGTIVSIKFPNVVVAEPSFPQNWVPTANVEPLNIRAVDMFYAAGPQDLGLVRQQWTNVGFPGPTTYWKRVGANQWGLTGLGASYPPLPAIIPHPVRGYPQ